MKVLRTVPNIFTEDLEAETKFYKDILGFELVMDNDWIRTFAAVGLPHTQVSVIGEDPSGLKPMMSIEVDDADAAYAKAKTQGFQIVYDIRNEPWGVRRFFVLDAAGKLINIVSHN